MKKHDDKVICIGNCYCGTGTHGGYAGDVFLTHTVAPCLMTMTGGGRMPHILEVKLGRIYNGSGGSFGSIVHSVNDTSPAITAYAGTGGGNMPHIIVSIPCHYDKHNGDKGFHSMDESSLRDFNAKWGGCVTRRYYKGISADGDNAVVVCEKKM